MIPYFEPGKDLSTREPGRVSAGVSGWATTPGADATRLAGACAIGLANPANANYNWLSPSGAART